MDRQKSVAKWGAACAPCAVAKAKCIRSNQASDAKCDRCQRLSKQCTGQVHRPRKKRVSKPSRTAQLEQRLNGLVDLLKATGELPTRSNGKEDSANGSSVATEAENSATSGQLPTGISRETLQKHGFIHIPSTYMSFTPPTCICRPEGGLYPEPTESDEVMVERFQKHMSPLFPFVVIHPGTIPAQLHATRPFLFMCIKMVASINNRQVMQGQMFKCMEFLSDDMLMRAGRSLDLLQGLIVVLGWYHHHCLMHAQMNNLIALAISLVASLGFNKPPIMPERTRLLVMDPIEPMPRTNAERRALLGVWYLNSTVSLGFGRIEPMRFSRYMQQCLKELEDSKEYDTDMYLVHLIKLQHLSEKITRINQEDEVEDLPGIPRAPVSAYQSAFQHELDRIKGSLSKSLKNNKFLMCHVHTAALHLYEPPTTDSSLLTRMTESITTTNLHQPSALDIFYRSHGALRAWFDHFFSIALSSYQWLPMPFSCQLIYAVIMLSRWSKLVIPVEPPETGKTPAPNDPSVNNPAASRTPGDEILVAAHPTPTATSPSPSVPGGRSAPAILAALKSQLQAQPELNLDIAGILAGLSKRFSQVDKEILNIGPMDSRGKREMSIWSLSARKIMIMRAKLEHWAEYALQGAEALLTKGGAETDSESEPDDEAGQSSSAAGAETSPPTSWDPLSAPFTGNVGTFPVGRSDAHMPYPGQVPGGAVAAPGGGGAASLETLDHNLWSRDPYEEYGGMASGFWFDCADADFDANMIDTFPTVT